MSVFSEICRQHAEVARCVHNAPDQKETGLIKVELKENQGGDPTRYSFANVEDAKLYLQKFGENQSSYENMVVSIDTNLKETLDPTYFPQPKSDNPQTSNVDYALHYLNLVNNAELLAEMIKYKKGESSNIAPFLRDCITNKKLAPDTYLPVISVESDGSISVSQTELQSVFLIVLELSSPSAVQSLVTSMIQKGFDILKPAHKKISEKGFLELGSSPRIIDNIFSKGDLSLIRVTCFYLNASYKDKPQEFLKIFLGKLIECTTIEAVEKYFGVAGTLKLGLSSQNVLGNIADDKPTALIAYHLKSEGSIISQPQKNVELFSNLSKDKKLAVYRHLLSPENLDLIMGLIGRLDDKKEAIELLLDAIVECDNPETILCYLSKLSELEISKQVEFTSKQIQRFQTCFNDKNSDVKAIFTDVMIKKRASSNVNINALLSVVLTPLQSELLQLLNDFQQEMAMSQHAVEKISDCIKDLGADARIDKFIDNLRKLTEQPDIKEFPGRLKVVHLAISEITKRYLSPFQQQLLTIIKPLQAQYKSVFTNQKLIELVEGLAANATVKDFIGKLRILLSDKDIKDNPKRSTMVNSAIEKVKEQYKLMTPLQLILLEILKRQEKPGNAEIIKRLRHIILSLEDNATPKEIIDKLRNSAKDINILDNQETLNRFIDEIEKSCMMPFQLKLRALLNNSKVNNSELNNSDNHVLIMFEKELLESIKHLGVNATYKEVIDEMQAFLERRWNAESGAGILRKVKSQYMWFMTPFQSTLLTLLQGLQKADDSKYTITRLRELIINLGANATVKKVIDEMRTLSVAPDIKPEVVKDAIKILSTMPEFVNNDIKQIIDAVFNRDDEFVELFFLEQAPIMKERNPGAYDMYSEKFKKKLKEKSPEEFNQFLNKFEEKLVSCVETDVVSRYFDIARDYDLGVSLHKVHPRSNKSFFESIMNSKPAALIVHLITANDSIAPGEQEKINLFSLLSNSDKQSVMRHLIGTMNFDLIFKLFDKDPDVDILIDQLIDQINQCGNPEIVISFLKKFKELNMSEEFKFKPEQIQTCNSIVKKYCVQLENVDSVINLTKHAPDEIAAREELMERISNSDNPEIIISFLKKFEELNMSEVFKFTPEQINRLKVRLHDGDPKMKEKFRKTFVGQKISEKFNCLIYEFPLYLTEDKDIIRRSNRFNHDEFSNPNFSVGMIPSPTGRLIFLLKSNTGELLANTSEGVRYLNLYAENFIKKAKEPKPTFKNNYEKCAWFANAVDPNNSDTRWIVRVSIKSNDDKEISYHFNHVTAAKFYLQELQEVKKEPSNFVVSVSTNPESIFTQQDEFIELCCSQLAPIININAPEKYHMLLAAIEDKLISSSSIESFDKYLNLYEKLKLSGTVDKAHESPDERFFEKIIKKVPNALVADLLKAKNSMLLHVSKLSENEKLSLFQHLLRLDNIDIDGLINLDKEQSMNVLMDAVSRCEDSNVVFAFLHKIDDINMGKDIKFTPEQITRLKDRFKESFMETAAGQKAFQSLNNRGILPATAHGMNSNQSSYSPLFFTTKPQSPQAGHHLSDISELRSQLKDILKSLEENITSAETYLKLTELIDGLETNDAIDQFADKIEELSKKPEITQHPKEVDLCKKMVEQVRAMQPVSTQRPSNF